MKIKFFSVGGTIDKIYFDAKSEYQIGSPQLIGLLEEANITFEYESESIMQKDSLEMTDADRQLLFDRVAADENKYIVVTHGTDTMVKSALKLSEIKGKTIVLTGALSPARFKFTDAEFNLGLAVAAVQCKGPGVYIAMSGRVFDADKVCKNVQLARFEDIEMIIEN
ncbi:MAG: asparaginase [Phycisphaerae bacterium]|nr:asparaginase [Phycisphaerae bacterium]